MGPDQLRSLLHPSPGSNLFVETDGPDGPTLRRGRVVATGSWQTIIEPDDLITGGRALLHVDGTAIAVDLDVDPASGRVRIRPVVRPLLLDRREEGRVQLRLPVLTPDGREATAIDLGPRGIRLAIDGDIPPTIVVPDRDETLVVAVHLLGAAGTRRRRSWRLAIDAGDRETAERWSALVDRALDDLLAGQDPRAPEIAI